MEYFCTTLTHFPTCSITAAILHEESQPVQSTQNISYWWRMTLIVYPVKHWCFTWHVLYTVFQHGYASLTAYICVRLALSERRTGHSVTWQFELKRCQHIRPHRDEFQQLTEHFVTVTEGHVHNMCPQLLPTQTHTHTHLSVSCNAPHWAQHWMQIIFKFVKYSFFVLYSVSYYSVC